MIDLSKEWSKQHALIRPIVARYIDDAYAMIEETQRGWDMWIEAEHPSEEEQTKELGFLMKNAFPQKLLGIYLHNWSKAYTREQMRDFGSMLIDLDCELYLAEERFTVDDLINAWNKTHPDEAPIHKAPEFEI